jgi:alpha/beta superfamily hydrolase
MSWACPPDSVTVESVRFRSAGWLLSGELVYAIDRAPLGAAVVAGPHPLLGGTMANNVVRALGDGLARLGFVTLRFDYSGVGASEGPVVDRAVQLTEFWQTSRTSEEVDFRKDLVAAATFLRQATDESLPAALIGYSFGCSVLADLPPPMAAAPRVLVAPTVGTHSYEAFATVQPPKLVIAPQRDFAIDDRALDEWHDRLPAPKRLMRPDLDGHFFRGHEDWLVETVGRFLLEVSV